MRICVMSLRRIFVCQPKSVHKRTLRAFLFLTTSMFLTPGLAADDGISVVQENGRTVYVNAESAQEKAVNRAAQFASDPHLRYWSVSEQRWKQVPKPSAA